ncbi:MAG: DUF3604 domain-containing protein, partial [Gammaproteobacteria bacterium]|nr:DUF3604 domain-containing protein [Gammaproteobacteria bacterium]
MPRENPSRTPRRVTTSRRALQAVAVAGSLAASATVDAEDTYAPTIRDTYPDTVYWGDTHVHTYLSADAFGLGTRATPEEAYRFAKGEEVVSTGGKRAKLRRPLDFLMISDHAENVGILPRLVGGDEGLLATEAGRRWAEFFAESPPAAE